MLNSDDMEKEPTAVTGEGNAPRIKWINEAKGEDGGISYWVSSDQRFDIEPLFSHATRPHSYNLHDRKNGTKRHVFSIRFAKQIAQQILVKTLADITIKELTQ